MKQEFPHYEVQCFRGESGMQQVRDLWHEVTDAMPSVRYYHLYEFHHAYFTSVEKRPDDVRIFVISKAGSPLAIMPLALRLVKIMGLPMKVFKLYPDAAQLDDICDCACRDCEAPVMQVLIDHLREQELNWHIISAKALETSCLARLLAGSPEEVAYTQVKSDGSATIPKHELDSVGDKLRTKPKSRCNQNIKMLQKLGEVDIRWVSDPEALPAALEAFVVLEDSGWKGEVNTSINSRQDFQNFYSALTRHFGELGFSRFIFLTLNEKPVAGHLLWVIGDTCFVPKVAYDEEYGKMGPGRVMCEVLFQRLSDEGIARVCNFIGVPPWLNTWETEITPGHRYVVYNSTVSGKVISQLSPLAKHLRKRLGSLTDKLK